MPGRIEGKVASISEAGNLVTDIASSQLDGVPTDDRVTVTCEGHETTGIYGQEHEQPEATLLAVVGQSDCLELEIVGDSARIMLGVSVGGKVEVVW